MKHLIITFLCWAGLLTGAWADNVQSGPGNSQALINWLALPTTVAGNTYTIAPGVHHWDLRISMNKAVTIKGSGIGVTTIKLDFPNTPREHTIVLSLNQNAPLVWRLSDFTLVRGLQTEGNQPKQPYGHILVHGQASVGDPSTSQARFAIERIKFSGGITSELIAVWTAWGVVAECVVGSDVGTENLTWTRVDKNSTGAGDNGDHSWKNIAESYGTDKFVFVEKCTYDRSGKKFNAANDGHKGQRVWWRYNIINNAIIGNHGAESGGGRGGAIIIAHDNHFSNINSGTSNVSIRYRSGTGFVFNNTYTGYATNGSVAMTPYILTGPSQGSWGNADGTRGWDNNDPANPHYTGTATAGSGLSYLEDTNANGGAGWAPGQLVGFTVKCVGCSLEGAPLAPQGDMNLGLIYDNGDFWIRTQAGNTTGSGTRQLYVEPGDSYQINKVLEAHDQAGRMGGTPYINTSSATVRAAGPSGAWTQYDSPIYGWKNLKTESPGNSISYTNQSHYSVRKGEHWFDQSVPPGSQQPGVMTGSKQEMLNVTPDKLGLGWWVTDEANWNAEKPGNDGQLYVAVSNGSGGFQWGSTPYFTPYTYPHPLRSSATQAGASPVVTVTSPANASTHTQGASITFTATATDAEDGNIAANLAWVSDLDGAIGTGATFNLATLSNGTHTIVASVTDSNGNLGSAGVTILVEAPVVPVVTITSPANGSTFRFGESITFTATATDAEDGNIAASLQWLSESDGPIGTGASFSVDSLSAGSHTITATAMDSSNNPGQDSVTITVRRFGKIKADKVTVGPGG